MKRTTHRKPLLSPRPWLVLLGAILLLLLALHRGKETTPPTGTKPDPLELRLEPL